MTQAGQARDTYVQAVQYMGGAQFRENWQGLVFWLDEVFGKFGVDITQDISSDVLGESLGGFHHEFRQLNDLANKLADVGEVDPETLATPPMVEFVDHALREFHNHLKAIEAEVGKFDPGRLGEAAGARLADRAATPTDVQRALQQFVDGGVVNFRSWAEELISYVEPVKNAPAHDAIAAETPAPNGAAAPDDGMPGPSRRTERRGGPEIGGHRRDTGRSERGAPEEDARSRARKLDEKSREQHRLLEQRDTIRKDAREVEARHRDARRAQAKQSTAEARKDFDEVDRRRAEYRRWDFEGVWADEEAKADFIAYCEFTSAEENVHFLDAVDAGDDPMVIYGRFIAPGAPEEINIDSAVRDRMAEAATRGALTADELKRVRKAVEQMVKLEPFVRYKNSEVRDYSAGRRAGANSPSSGPSPAGAAGVLAQLEVQFDSVAPKSYFHHLTTLDEGRSALSACGVQVAREVFDNLKRKGSGASRDLGGLGIFFIPPETAGDGTGSDKFVIHAPGKLTSSVRRLGRGEKATYTQYGKMVIMDPDPDDVLVGLVRYAATTKGASPGGCAVVERSRMGGAVRVTPLYGDQDTEAFEAEFSAANPGVSIKWRGDVDDAAEGRRPGASGSTSTAGSSRGSAPSRGAGVPSFQSVIAGEDPEALQSFKRYLKKHHDRPELLDAVHEAVALRSRGEVRRADLDAFGLRHFVERKLKETEKFFLSVQNYKSKPNEGIRFSDRVQGEKSPKSDMLQAFDDMIESGMKTLEPVYQRMVKRNGKR